MPVYNEVFSDYQLGKVVQFFRDKHFEDHLCPCPTALVKKSDIPKENTKRLTPYASAPLRLYGLPKIPK
jgi:hypothetical protein